MSLLDNYFIVEVQENGTLLKLVFLGSVEDQTLVFLHVVWYWNLGREERGKRRGGGVSLLERFYGV